MADVVPLAPDHLGRQDLEAMRFGPLQGNPALSDKESRFARATGQGVLRFLIGDACMTAFFSRSRDQGEAFVDGRIRRPPKSLWLDERMGDGRQRV